MKICFLVQDPGLVYGAEQATLDLAAGLRDRGISVGFLLIRERRVRDGELSLAAAARRDGFEVVEVATAWRFSPVLVARVRARLGEIRPDMVHVHGVKALLVGELAVGWGGGAAPMVHTVHGWLERGDWKESLYNRLERRLAWRVAAVVAVSEYSRGEILAAGCPPDLVHLIRSAPAPGRVAAPAGGGAHVEAGRPFTVGMMARFTAEKRQDILVDAAAELARGAEPIRMILAGDGPGRAAAARQVRRLGLDAVVHLPGYVAPEEFLGSVDVVAHCSRAENRPFAVMEAMCRALPVVASRVGGLPELVEDGRTGMLVDPDDVGAVVRALQALWRDPTLRERLGRAGRRALAAERRYPAACSAHVDLYRTLPARPPPPPERE